MILNVPSGPFVTIYLDPPWPENGGGKIKRGADRHYPTIKCSQMFSIITLSGVWNIADDAHCYMWVTNNYLPQGLRLMQDLDFRYVTNLAWIKDKSGLGQYFRGKHELMLFGVRGDGYTARTARRNIETVIDKSDCYGAPRGKHSAKPHLFNELIEARSSGPYLEMFARNRRVGWTSRGNEVQETR